MPLFLSDEELESLRHDGVAVAERADSFIRNLYAQLETVKAQADAASITAEQTCSQLEHNFLSLSSDYTILESRFSELESTLQERLSELAQVKSDKLQLHLKSIEKEGELERMSTVISEVHNSKRQLMAMLEQKNAEISEKNSTMESYLDKIVKMTENMAERQAKLNDAEAELVRSQAACERLLLEKELMGKHNAWLNEELTAKTNSLMDLHKKHAEHDADMSAKLRDVEKKYEESSESIKLYKERVSEFEMKLTSLQEELCARTDSAATTEQHYIAEISTASKLVELYKESSEEWSKKAGELEGVIKALEMHLSQLQNAHKENVEKQEALRKEVEKEAAELKDKLVKCEAEIESNRKARELRLLPFNNFSKEGWIESFDSNENGADDLILGPSIPAGADNLFLGPSIPAGVSGTALAAGLIRDGWSLAKMYAKYQEAVDAFQHEQLGRKQSQAVLERVLLEIEEKASVILDERAEHERMADAYAMMNERLHQSLSEQAKLEKIIEGLKADLRRRERDYNLTQKEIEDLQKQVTILLKECRDIQLRCGSAGTVHPETDVASLEMNVNAEGNAETVISEHLISFHGINGLVEQNVKLRSLVRSLSFQIENKENELKEQFEVELEKHSQEAASKVSIVLERAQQQERMIDSLHSSVAMYKRLYDEEHKLRSSDPQTLPLQASGRVDQVLLLESSQNSAKQVQEQFTQRVRSLEEELTTLRSENASLRVERDKYLLETNFSQEKLERYVKDMEYQRKEMNEVLSRNVEFQRLIVDYQNQMRESSQSLLAAEELSRKLTMEVSILTREKDLLQNAERRACDEVRDLSMRVHRLQASLDTVHTTEQVHEEARSAERKKLEEHAKHIEREWAEAKKALQVERDNSRVLSLDRDKLIADAMRQIEEMRKELASALQSATAAETRAAASEARCSDLERNLNTKTYDKDGEVEDVSSSASEIMRDLSMAKEEIERLKLELQSNKDHMIQYKKIAEVNEAALKQMESSFELFRSEADNRKNLLEEEISSLRERIFQLQNESSLRSDEASSAATERDAAFASLQLEITELKDAVSTKTSQIVLMEVQISSLKTDLEKEHQKWRAAQENYERQVILQGETIQELTKTSEALALLQEESSELRKLVDAYKSENDELKAKWAMEKSELERCKVEAENKYNEINEQNKLLHNRLDAMHIKAAEGHRQMAGITSAATSSESESDSGLHTVISYLRRSKEIAETEITLLKQEKLRLQSQLERALKDAEAAQASLSEERANARTLVFSEAEFKSLQLQVGEMNLLRESNRQLRAENEQLVKDCKSLREDFHKEKVKIDNLMTLLREKEMVAETLRKEIDAEREEKENSQKRISELLEKSKNIDFEKLKDDFQQMQVKMQEKEGEMEKIRSSLSEKEEIISKLKHELAGARNELIEKENHVSQFEANLKADLQKKFNLQLKRRVDLHLKEKEALLKEKESAVKEKESLLMEKESLCKEKEEKGKEIEGLLKQLEEKKQETKATGDVDYHTLVNEKDKRIQTLERVIEKEREEKRKEKEKRVNIEKVIQSKVSSVDQERKKFEDELEKDKEAVKRISDELDKLRHARDSLPEGTAVVQLLSSNVLDDRASAYVSAIESFEKAAHSVIVEHGVHTNSSTPVTDMSTLTGGPVAPAPVLAPSSSMASPARPQQKTVDDREKKTIAPKNNVEIRKPARKLVRPRLVKSEEPQGDSEMAETEGKPGPSTDTETRKRIAVSSASELHDESLQQALKRPKSMEPPQKDTIQAHSRLENVETPAAASEDVPDVSTDFPEGFTEDITDLKKDDTDLEEHKESHPSEETQILYDDDTNMTENPDKVVECELSQPAGDMEEGEVSELSSGADGGGEETPNNNELEELQPETDASPLRTDDEEQSEDVNEMTPPEELNGEKNEEGETTEDTITEDVNDGDQVTGESEQINETTVVVAEATNVDNTVSKEGSQAMSSAAATSSTTINLNVRAKEMAARRLALPQRPATTQSPASISPATRGRGRVPTRARGRALRGGRRAPPGDRN